MKLKALTLNGFKSFADKTKIEFQPGMTGIVGPNGSGKSNIIEALRWVLGEQSVKSLRGGKMPDVIFAGSQTRAPLNRAEVVIELDNSDGFLKQQPPELVITRRIYRDGESEFLINQKKVRLREIVDLFMDTGLGRESFSIISQGRVEAIFNSKPLERRVLIEEVAGVLKYKKEKHRAQKELEETTGHLNRVADIITELYQQKQPLEEQASIARDYLEQKKQYDYFDLNNLVLEIKAKSQKRAEIQAELAKIKDLVAKHSQSASKQEQLTANLHQQQQQLEAKLDAAQERLVELTKQKGYLSGEEKVSKQTREYQELQRKDTSNRLEIDQKNLRELKEQEAKLEAQLAQVQAQKADYQAKIDQLTADANIDEATLNEQVEKLRQELFEKSQDQSALQSQHAYLKRESEHSQSLTASALAKHKELEAAYQAAEEKKHQAKTDLLAAKETVAQLDQRQAELTSEVSKYQLRYDNQKERWYEASDILKQAQTRYETLKNVATSYDGYYQGVKQVLQAKGKLAGVIGAVAEIITVPQEFSQALEAVLAGQLQNVVVTTDEAAKQAINYLRANKLGRATFLPRNTVKRRALTTKQRQILASQQGIVGVASELVTVNAADQPILDYLLGTTIVVKSLAEATVVARALNHSLRIVTLTGDIVNAGGSMSGGANQQRKIGLLEQKQQLERLAANIDLMKSKLATVELEGNEAKQQLTASKQAVQQLAPKLQAAQTKLQQCQQQFDISQVELSHQEQQLRAEAASQEEQTKASMQAQTELKEVVAKLDQLEQAIAQLKEQLAYKQEFLNDTRTSQAKNQQKLTTLKQELAVVEERLQSVKLQANEVANQIKRLSENIAKAKERLAILKQEQELRHGQVEDLADKQAKVKQEHAQLEQTVAKMIEQRKTLHAQVAQAEEQLKRASELKAAAYDEQSEKARQDSKLEAQLDGLLTDLADRHELSYEAASKLENLETDIDYVKRRLKLLQLGLDELGDVNLGAISEFDRVNERYEFLAKQQDDLLAAKAQLEKSMQEMDGEVKRRFKQTFEEVAQAFEEIFPAIFGGGRAKLSLTDSDLLTTGVEIMAQPPGKKFQTLTLLSGGEKALTAIALLFAILKVRPVPFVVLDEAEAALDDANVVRYSQYLQNFEGKTQFIVITHRKGTMMNADILYGVTMQESGVSKMVSVSLAQLEQ